MVEKRWMTLVLERRLIKLFVLGVVHMNVYVGTTLVSAAADGVNMVNLTLVNYANWKTQTQKHA